MLVDSHCHIEMPEFDDDREAVIERARAAGVGFLLVIGDATNQESLAAGRVLAERTHIATTAGMHPHQARDWSDRTREFIASAVRDPRVAAIGEVGLDYHYDYSPRSDQRKAFEEQAQLAASMEIPLIVHCREAESDVHRVLARACRPGRLNGIMHCFTGNLEFARLMYELGFLISFSGIVTFPRAAAIQEAAADLPDDAILVETDAPYLAPVPHRGKRNEPAFVRYTAEALGRLRGRSADEIAALTTSNFFRLFPGLRKDDSPVH